MRTRSLTVVSAAAVAVLVTAGCSSDSSSDDADVRLTMTMWTSNPDQLALFEEIGDAFMEQHPGVTEIEFESLTLDQLDSVLTTRISADDSPDLTWLPVESSLEYIEAGALVDVSDVLRNTEGYDYDDLVPALHERWRVDDAQYGVPFSTGPLVMYYNKDLYAQAGVTSPDELISAGDWTWESFRRVSKELADATGVPGYVVNDFEFKNWTRLLPILFAYGASPWNDDASECTADSPEFVEAMSLFHGMVYTDGSSPVPGEQADFWSGQAGATTAFLSSNALLEDAAFAWGIVPTPGGPAGEVQALGQAAITVLSASRHQEAAQEFLAFLTNEENAASLAQFWPPARTSLLEPSVLVGESAILTEEVVQPIIEATKSTGQIFPVAIDNSGVADALDSSLDEHVWQPAADLPAALAEVCDAIDPLLAGE